MYIGKSTSDPVVVEAKSLVIDTKLVQNRGMNVVDFCRVLSIERLITPLVALAMCYAPFDPAATEPVGEDVRIVIASRTTL